MNSYSFAQTVDSAQYNNSSNDTIPSISYKQNYNPELDSSIDQSVADSLKYPLDKDYGYNIEDKRNIVSLRKPENIVRHVEFDPNTNTYEIWETIGGQTYRYPKKLTLEEYTAYMLEQNKQDYWDQKSGVKNEMTENRGLIPRLDFKSSAFDDLFGGSYVDIRPQGFAEITLSTKTNKNDNPLLTTKQRKQTSLDFDQAMQINLEGQVGDKLKITTNFNSEAQFDYENQLMFEYTGYEDEIIQKVEIGNVSMPLPGTLIDGSQSLFGIKTQMQFGNLGVTALVSQQRSESEEIKVTNGGQEQDFEITVDNYEANKHYFLSTYFRDNYNEALLRMPTIESGVQINKIEVWVTNKTNNNTDSRDILAFLDLGENDPHNDDLFRGGSGYAENPAGYGSGKQSNNLLQVIPPSFRYTRDNSINSFFAASGGSDNFAKLTYARLLTDKEYKLNPVLGYISLNQPLNNDEVLAVAYRYTLNGKQYQVGEFSTDVTSDSGNPIVLYTKLLKNELLKVNLPTWDLMMKNIYSLNGYQIGKEQFRLNVFRLDDKTGVEQPVMPEGQNTSGKPYIQLVNLDRLNSQNGLGSDGVFDFVQNITIDADNGRIIFPVVEPFGEDLAKQFLSSEIDLINRYVYQPLYDSTRYVAQQYAELNRYKIKGSYKSSVSAEYNLNAINIPEGSVVVMSGSTRLVEGVDYTVDYNLGTVRIINDALLNSGQTITIKLESTEMFGMQSKTMAGIRLDYAVNEKLSLGSTFMSLTERPMTEKVSAGDEAISNKMYGFDASYRTESDWLTRMVDKIPGIEAEEKSSIAVTGEFAQLIQGHPKATEVAGDKGGVSYIDDFETTRSIIDLKSSTNWFISGTPQMFSESSMSNDLAYGYNRALMSYYTIDPVFYATSNKDTPDNIRNNREELSKHSVREVTEQEVFPNKESTTGSPLFMPTFDITYYPRERGPYNYTTTGINPDGTLSNPAARWGGIYRKLDQNDFQSLNVEYIEFWVMDPFLHSPNSTGGDLYFNLGSISEDVLKDGTKSVEHSLPAKGEQGETISTVWGKAGKTQPVTQGFDNDPEARKRQDVGIDGIPSTEEQTFFASFLNTVKGIVSPKKYQEIASDPSGDNFVYYLGPDLDAAEAGIMERYKHYNGMESNSKTTQQAKDELGLENASSTTSPDGEDINRDNNMSTAEEYFQYKVSIRKGDMEVGKNFVTDKVESSVKLPNGLTEKTTWYQVQIPITAFADKVGGIQDFKSIRFIRMFTTGFQDSVIMRFAKLQLVRGEWKEYNPLNEEKDQIKDPAVPGSIVDASEVTISTINIEENGNRRPIPYVVPPGINQQEVYGAYREVVKMNEQSLSMKVENIQDGFTRATYKNLMYDFRNYKKLKMFIHAEGSDVEDYDLSAVVRLGSDYDQNYYEYEIPLKVTKPNQVSAYDIWPEENNMEIVFESLQKLKIERNDKKIPIADIYSKQEGNNKISVVGNPDLSKVKIIMMSVRNPYSGTNNRPDDGSQKTAEIWFNELRAVDFTEDGGVAVTGTLSAKLSDFATVNFSGGTSTAGFGGLDQDVSSAEKSQNSNYDVSANMELGKFLPEESNISIPMYVSFAQDIVKEEYLPTSPDLLLKDVLDDMSKTDQDSLLNLVNDVTTRKSFNFTNVRKNRDADQEVKFYDIENFSATFAYTKSQHRDYSIVNSEQRTIKAILGYNYQKDSRNIKPFSFLFQPKKPKQKDSEDLKAELDAKAKQLKDRDKKKRQIKNPFSFNIIKDFNFNVAPQIIDMQLMLDRYYDENEFRATDETNNYAAPATYSKSMYINGNYNVGWDLTNSLRADFTARSRSSVDESQGAITAESRDSLMKNLLKFGRPVEYSQQVGFTYTIPMSKIKFLSWTSASVKYTGAYDWLAEPLSTAESDTARMGNTIQNSAIVQFSGQLNLSQLYNKARFLKDKDPKKFAFSDIYKGFITMTKNISGTYSVDNGTFLPGYLPTTNVFSSDPGLGFMLGSQKDIRYTEAAEGNFTYYDGMNSMYVQDKKVDVNYRIVLEPAKDLRIELTGTKGTVESSQSNFKYDPAFEHFTEYSPTYSGSISVSTIALGSAFSDTPGESGEELFNQMEASRLEFSHRLGAQNPNSIGYDDAGYADGYGAKSQGVVLGSFVSTYLGKDPTTMDQLFTNVPLPNWRVTYGGLSKVGTLGDLFSSVTVTHGYKATQAVSSYESLLDYTEDAFGFPISRTEVADANGNYYFLPEFQVSAMTITEEFSPLLGVDVRFKNNITANAEYRKSRTLSMSLSNAQLSNQFDQQIIFGVGYRKMKFILPFEIGTLNNYDNELNVTIDFAIRENQTIIYELDNEVVQTAGGTSTLSFRPSVDYLINNRFNFKVFMDQNITKPKTSNSYNTSYTNVGVTLRVTL